jgi:hypothetical protein
VRRVLVDYNTVEFLRPSGQSIAVLERMNPQLENEWMPIDGEVVLLVDHDGVEYIARMGMGERFRWVADIA